MRYDLMQFKSLTYAQQGARTLERAGISAYILRCPTGLAARGCSYCVRIPDQRREMAADILRENGQEPLRLFVRELDGTYREVPI